MGPVYDAIVPLGKGCFSRGGTHLCPVPNQTSRAIPSIQVYSTQLPFGFLKVSPLQSTTSFSKHLSWSDLSEFGEHRLRHTPRCPWLLRVWRTSVPGGQLEQLLGLETGG